MHLLSTAFARACPQALTRLAQALDEGQRLSDLADPRFDLDQPMSKDSLNAVIGRQGPTWLNKFFQSTCEKGECLPVKRLTLVGSLLVRVLKDGQRALKMAELCDFLALHHHTHVPIALTAKPGAAFADGLDLLQFVAQWRWRGQARPMNMDAEMSALAAALACNATPALFDDLGRTARWCVQHDWGKGDAARQGQIALRTFAAIVKQGARIGPTLNFIAFPDQIDRCGHLPVLLALMRHAPLTQLLDIVKQMLAQGAHPDARSGHGRTALMACLDSRLGEEAWMVSQSLLAYGANAALTDSNGLSVLTQLAAIEKAHRQPMLKLAIGGNQAPGNTLNAADCVAPTGPFPFRHALVSAIQSSLARHQARSILDDIDNEIRTENCVDLAA